MSKHSEIGLITNLLEPDNVLTICIVFRERFMVYNVYYARPNLSHFLQTIRHRELISLQASDKRKSLAGNPRGSLGFCKASRLPGPTSSVRRSPGRSAIETFKELSTVPPRSRPCPIRLFQEKEPRELEIGSARGLLITPVSTLQAVRFGDRQR